MSKPDTDDGWFKMAIELEAALAYADFSKVARVVLADVFLQIFGKGTRPKLAYLPQKSLSSRIAQKSQAINRAIRELVESGVLIEARDDQYRFVKDYTKWVAWSRDRTIPIQPRLSKSEVEECRKMPAYSASFQIKESIPSEDPSVTIGLQNCNHPVTEENSDVTIGLQNCNHRVTADVTIGLQNCNHRVTSPLIGTGARPPASEFNSEDRDKRERGESARTAGRARPRTGASPPSISLTPKQIRDQRRYDDLTRNGPRVIAEIFARQDAEEQERKRP